MVKEFIVHTNRPIFEEELKRRLPVIMEALGVQAEQNAVRESNKMIYDTPESPTYKRTGRLRNSISHGVVEDKVIIGTNLEYAPYVELGTYRMPSRPFLRNGISNYRDEYKRIIEDGLK